MIYSREDEVIRYDFNGFISTFESMKDKCSATPSDLVNIKSELNKFFSDSDCKEVIYTTNTDKMFFGLKIIPMINPDDIYKYIVEDEPERLDRYIVEIDSKLLDPIMNLSSYELLAILLHEVSNIVNDTFPIENARNALNSYLSSNREHVKITQSVHYKEILAYGLKDYLSKARSMFYTNDLSDILANDFAHMYGFENDLVSAYEKISKNNIKLYENSEVSKFIVFSWALSIYRNLRIRRVGAIKTLSRAMLLSGSRLERMEMENVIRRIKRIDDDILIESARDDAIVRKVEEKMKKLRMKRLNNIKYIDNHFYELNLRIRNVQEEEDALYLMREINSSIAVVDEYLNTDGIDEYERDMYTKIINKFQMLREKLSNSTIYKGQQYGMFVKYPDIVENRY